ncbi:MAG TPA: hypothetical protein VH044_18445 [Polyangiaceae bacterium]|jgi:hypothetical protein|nr:hypothetical protein [Polyangiaceae bacterium]
MTTLRVCATVPTRPQGRLAALLLVATAGAALAGSTGCSSLTPPFNTMKEAQMTVYRLQNFEPPAAAQAPAAAGLQLPPQIQQWITAGASLLPPGLLPPGLIPGTTPAAPAAPDAQRFHGFRILEWQPVNDAGVKSDITDLFGHGSNFQNAPATCMFAEFGFAMGQINAPAPADVLVSLSCEQVQAFNFAWPYPQTGVTPGAAQKVASIAGRVFQGH